MFDKRFILLYFPLRIPKSVLIGINNDKKNTEKQVY